MPEMVLTYDFPGARSVDERPLTFSALVQRLNEIRDRYSPMAGCPFSVDLVKDNGSLSTAPEYAERLSIGLGNGEWMIVYNPGLDQGPFLYSLGDEHLEGTVPFFYGQWSELSRKYLIPKDDALEAVRVWFEEGVLSDAIRWTTKIYSGSNQGDATDLRN